MKRSSSIEVYIETVLAVYMINGWIYRPFLKNLLLLLCSCKKQQEYIFLVFLAVSVKTGIIILLSSTLIDTNVFDVGQIWHWSRLTQITNYCCWADVFIFY